MLLQSATISYDVSFMQWHHMYAYLLGKKYLFTYEFFHSGRVKLLFTEFKATSGINVCVMRNSRAKQILATYAKLEEAQQAQS